MLRRLSLLSFIIFVLVGMAKDSLALTSIESTLDGRWLDRSAKIFLPRNLSSQVEARQFFPLLWWNFLVLEFDNEEAGFKRASDLCDRLKTLSGTLIAKTGCRQDLAQFKPLLNAWAQDQFVRNESPSPETFAAKLNSALAKASLPEGGDLLAILRMDPLESYKELQNHVEARVQLKLPKKFGFFIDEKARRIVIPVQFNFPPFDSAKTLLFRSWIEKDKVHVIGPHASSFENEKQVTQDLGVVSTTGTLLLLLLGIAVLVSRRWKLLLIAPPVFLSTVISTLLTILIFGSIHGLTLSFGTGIIGIAIDFGLHSVFNRNYGGIWKANAFGLYTTIAALIVMMFSSIPLLQQIMVFATLGITSGYAILYLLDRSFPELFDVKPIAIKVLISPIRFATATALVMFSIIGVATINLSLDMSRFDFQDEGAQGLNAWLFQNLDSKPPLMQIHNVEKNESPLDFAHAQKTWAEQSNVRYEGIANYLPPVAEQQRNFDSWSRLINSEEELLTPLQQTIFAPFVHALKGAQPRALLLGIESPLYVADFQHQSNKGSWLSLWLPRTDKETELIKSRFADSLSFKEVVSVFPRTLFQELAWMVPLSFFLTLALLAFYFRHIYPTLLSLIPFFSGLGLFAVAALTFNYSTSFITVIGFVMVFGFSVDYGIFATDLVIGKKRSVTGVWSALSLSALIATLGFVPLMFCRHPVLLQLGQPLVLGTIGTYIGTIWGIPGCVKYLKGFRVRT